jgi:hypothetical protein
VDPVLEMGRLVRGAGQKWQHGTYKSEKFIEVEKKYKSGTEEESISELKDISK